MRWRPDQDDAETLRLICVIEKGIKAENLPAHGGLFLCQLARQGGEALLSDVREACLIGSTQSSRVAEALEDMGLLIRKIDSKDGRFTEVRLTVQGRGVVERMIQAARSRE